MLKYNKTRELAYVLMRLAFMIRHAGISERVQASTLEFLEEVARSDFKKASLSVAVLAELIVLGRELYEIDPVHADYLLMELSNINSAIRQLGGYKSLPDQLPDMEKIFKPKNDINLNEIKEDYSDSLNSAIRQSAIADKIRQFSDLGCQMKDLLAAFSEVSERTLRYDLQKLLSQGTIERTGFGPASSYRVIVRETTR